MEFKEGTRETQLFLAIPRHPSEAAAGGAQAILCVLGLWVGLSAAGETRGLLLGAVWPQAGRVHTLHTCWSGPLPAPT